MLAMAGLLKLENLKVYAIVLALIAAIWFYKDYNFQKSENIRQSENNQMLRRFDSLRFASNTYSKKELEEYLEYNRRDLQEFLKENRIRTKNIEQIISQSLKYRDTISKETNLQPILDAIRENRELKIPVIDSTDCMIISGYVSFEKDTLKLNITDRKFINKSDIIKHWERNQWSFLGIKTRFLGYRKLTVTIKDDCGNTETFVIDKRK